MSEISFEEQIRLEEEERRRKKSGEAADETTTKDADEFGRVFAADGLSYADKDGCVFEWVADKNAWFPKIDEDFIARYQMNYGVVDDEEADKRKEGTENAGAKEGGGGEEEEEEDEEKKNAEAYRQWYSQYQRWYNSQIPHPPPKDSEDASSLHSGGEGSETGSTAAAAAADGDALPPMPEDPNSDEYREWYAKWMEREARLKGKKKKKTTKKKNAEEGKEEKAEEGKEEKEKTEKESTGDQEEEEEGDDDDDEEDEDEEEEYTYEDYMRYWNYYYAPMEKEEEKVQVGKKRKAPSSSAAAAAKEPPAWFDVEDRTKNTNVYASDLPTDITAEEFKEFMSKVGIIMIDETTRQPKIKLYVDENGRNKGDGRCCYLKYESVLLAEQILDGYELKGKVVKVEQARFALKGEYDPTLRKKKKKINNNKKKNKKNAQEKMLEWELEKGRGQRAKREKTTVLKNVFAAEDFDADPTLVNVLRDAVEAECAQFGAVKKVVVHDRNPEGVVRVIFAEAEHSDGCIAATHERLRAGRKITAECWDGKTKYDVEETDEERRKRIDKWQKYLAGEEEEEEEEVEGGKGGGKKEEEKKCPGEAATASSSSTSTASSSKEEARKGDREEEGEEGNDADEDAREDERQNDFLENDDED